MTVQAINISAHAMHPDFPLSASPSSMSPTFASSSSSSSSSSGSLLSAGSFATTISEASSSSPASDDLAAMASSSSLDDCAAAAKKHKPHKCDVCGASFARKVHLQRHSLRHQVCKPYCCERCGKCFSRQDSLVRHHRLLHEGGREANQKLKTTSSTIKKKSASISGPSSSPSATTTSTATNKKRPRQRHDSVATTVSSMASEEEGADSTDLWAALNNTHSAHGPRRDTASSVASSIATVSEFTSPVLSTFGAMDLGALQQQQQPMIYHANSFDMPMQQQVQQHHQTQLYDLTFAQQQEELKGLSLQHDNGMLQTAMNMPHLLSLLPPVQQQHTAWSAHNDGTSIDMPAQMQLTQEQLHASIATIPTIDWTSLMLQQQFQQQQQLQHAGEQQFTTVSEQAMMKQPFSGAASDKAINATLLGGDDHHRLTTQDSAFPSPSIHGSMLGQASGVEMINGMSHLGIHIGAAHLPLNAAMSSDNWEGLMRSLSQSNSAGQQLAEGMTA